jgi:integrase
VSEFNPATLERWLSSRTQNPKTFNEYRNAFNALFGFAVKSNALKANPVADIKRRRLERRDVEIYSPAEAQKLLAAAQQAGPEMLVYISLAAFAGVRPHEIAGTEEHPGLDWKDIGATSIKVPANVAKNKRSRTIALQPNLAALLAPHRQTSGAVCPGLLPQEVSLQLSTAAGVRWIHDGLRHSFSSYRAVQAGHLVACKENGDTLQVFDRHYLTREPVSQEQAEAYFALGLPAANTVQFPVANAG